MRDAAHAGDGPNRSMTISQRVPWPRREHANARREACRVAIEDLPDREREVVTLRYLFALPTKDIASLLNTSGNAVDQALVRGIERLKRARPRSGSG